MHEQEYQQALITIKDKIRENEGPDMKESMQDQIRQWFIEVRSVRNLDPTVVYRGQLSTKSRSDSGSPRSSQYKIQI